MRRITGVIVGIALAVVGVGVSEVHAASLRGSASAMVQQNTVAKEHGLAFYRTAEEILQAAARGELVELRGDENYEVADFVRFPYLQPEVHLFVERLAAQYREACGQKLVVTSAVRPSNGQPSNAHRLSVHPAGMAVDLRVSDRASCRQFLENAILSLERRGVLNGIREFHPPHYHVAVFPGPYLAYAEERIAAETEAERAAREAERARQAAHAPAIAEIADAPVVAGFVAADAQPQRSGGPMPLFAAAALVMFVLPFGLGVLWRRRKPGARRE